MNILFLSPCRFPHPSSVSDYQLDSILHGLKHLDDIKVYECPNHRWLYNINDKDYVNQIWGKGFTLYNKLKSTLQLEVNFDDRIEFDIVIYGLHHSSYNLLETHIHNLCKAKRDYPQAKIAIIDGHDTNKIYYELCQLGVYFKRELETDSSSNLRPIQFSFPENLIQNKTVKNRHFAQLVPVNQCWNSEHSKSYIYNDESEYYQGYNESYFAYTTKKGGWDTLRHYEILMCNCLPFFLDIEQCPKNTLFKYPKELCKKIKHIPGVYPGIQDYNPNTSYDCRSVGLRENRGYIGSDFSYSMYQECFDEMIEIRKTMTTTMMAKYLLESIIHA